MRVIELSRGFVAVISKEDYRKVNRYSWHVHFAKGSKKKIAQPYARANIGGKKVYLHRFITGADRPWLVDHINGQTLDCRRSNLEVVDVQTNTKRYHARRK